MRFRLLLAGSLLVVVGLLGLVPAAAQDEATTQDGEESAEELLDRALSLVSAVGSGDADQLPLRVEISQHVSNALSGDLPAGVGLPDITMAVVILVDSAGDSEYAVKSVSVADDAGLADEQRSALEEVASSLDYVVIGDYFYWPISVPFMLEILQMEDPWLKLDLSQRMALESSDLERVQQLFTGYTSPLSFFSGSPGDDEYMLKLLGTRMAGSARIAGEENIRGHDTTKVEVGVGAFDLFEANSFFVLGFTYVAGVMDFVLAPPDLEFLEETLDPSFQQELQVWIGDDGRIHRTYLDIGDVGAEYLGSVYPGLPLGEGDVEFSLASEFHYLDDDPQIEAPPAEQTATLEDFRAALAETREAASGDPEGEEPADTGDSGAGGDSGEGLADTGVDTLLLTIVGIAVVLAGAMVFGLSRRLRTD